ncbi:ATP-grasp domain-containing protein [Gordonia westfalica]|uniref:ATP-grasp domain-containing protein n=1 Tax=Gordonia westfalica TaxID=158898 RepID=A0ABU2GRW8_9ACTN|nr:ATP-grasp domain-containing protein [Gordonia westfalica]MDS1114203.1 ATP-grasp domain-containing protein [Gordonia westfalica]
MDSAGRAHVLITFGRSFLSLELARLMAAGGHRVTTVDSIPVAISRFSNGVSGFHRVPPPKFEPLEYCRALARIVEENDVDMVIPVHEETDIIAMLAELFPPRCRLFLSDFDIENRLHHKYEFQELLVELGIPTRKFARVAGPEDAGSLDFDKPFALKRSYSRGSQKVHKVQPGDPLTWLEHDEQNPWVAQEWISGDKYCTYSVCHEGRIYAHATYPVDYAIDGSSCLNFRSVDHPRIQAWVADIVERVNFTGQIGFDFIEDGPDKDLFCIECNPRATSGIMMFSPGDGVDRAFLGTSDPDTEIIAPAPDVDRMIGLGMMLYGWRAPSRNGRSFRQFVRDFRGASDVITRPGDQKPAMMLPFAYAGILRSCVKYRVGLAEGFMHDHEWDGLRISL